jgi:hypothetical protein
VWWSWLPMSGAAIMIIVLLIGLRPVARCRFSATWIREQRAPITAELRTEVENARWQQRVGGIAGSIVATLFWRNAVRGERLCEVCSLPVSLGLPIIVLIMTALPRTRGPNDDLMWNLVLVMVFVTSALAFSGQQLLHRGPSGKHRDAALQAARRAYETV